ncbi:MAG: acylphosphatase [Gammaproteobacteria bacterium]|nr:acylphosphatase [Gammaproteobacteria bacterium]
MIICKKCYVSGKVQGVFYRASTASKARSLGITGSARNLPDGRVEVIACGSQDSVSDLCAWLWQGPELAEVDNVECEELVMSPPADFRTA